jgi:hypothetical protein
VIALFSGWVGAAAMTAAPFLIDSDPGKSLAIIGLALLSIQALKFRAWNLIILNFAGIIGYSYSIWS